MYFSWKQAAADVVAAVNSVNPIAPEETEQYEEYIEKALKEDTGGLLSRCDMAHPGIVRGAMLRPGTHRAVMETCFPKTWQTIKEIEKNEEKP